MAQRDIDDKRLLDRRAAETRAEIVEAAIGLFVEHGFDATSMSDVAAAAGMSRRTLYRYFATKDDIVFDAPRQWLEVVNDVLSDRGESESTRDVCRRALLAVAAYVRDNAASVLRSYSVVAASPELASRHGRSDAEGVQHYLELLGPEVARLEDGVLQAVTAAMALVGAQNAIIVVWAQRPGADPVELTRKVLDQVDSIWPEPCRRAPDVTNRT